MCETVFKRVTSFCYKTRSYFSLSFKVFPQCVPVLLMVFSLVLDLQTVLFVACFSGCTPGDLLHFLFGLPYVLSKTPAICFDETQRYISGRKGKPLLDKMNREKQRLVGFNQSSHRHQEKQSCKEPLLTDSKSNSVTSLGQLQIPNHGPGSYTSSFSHMSF